MILDKYCLQCGDLLADDQPVNKQYCNGACRQSAYRDRLDEPQSEETEAPETVSAEEGGNQALVWLGLFGAAVWLLTPTGKTRNKPVTTRPLPPTWPTLDEL